MNTSKCMGVLWVITLLAACAGDASMEDPQPLDASVGVAEQALSADPSHLIDGVHHEIDLGIDPSGGVLATGGTNTKKTPCEKATNQFYRAQSAYLAAAAALNACGYSFTPGCESLAASFNTAAATLDAAYAKFLNEC